MLVLARFIALRLVERTHSLPGWPTLLPRQ